MKRRIILSYILILSFALNTASAQKKTTATPELNRRATDQIRALAREKVKALSDLLNAIANEDLTTYDRKYVILNSYMPSNDQLFFNDGVIVEDDIDPAHTAPAAGSDAVIDRYLSNLDLFYQKSTTNTIEFSNIVVGDVKAGEKYPYVKVFFTSEFKGKHKSITTPYKPTQRVAEFIAASVDDEWIVYITRLAFQSPTAMQDNIAALPVSTSTNAEKPTDMAKAEPKKETPASVKNLGKQVSSASAQKQKTTALIKVGVGVAALAFGTATFLMLNSDHADYKKRISNAEGITSYAAPGIYISAGAAAVGVGIGLTSLGNFKKAKR
ncbi:hypothetical protein [Persicitalea jodogahamensis]|uniref:Uncharacterized protein n=1 Tax=Persicitalea jodogahamensis TaxID=402147 RepID=A0A8J3G7N5_9BACT|nr:hypothetical protein [Persicitalea jodogahamensis]GHB52081.1 hypothetical protein GCM10007390_00870 [Persicitalea jodogahamensis]